MTQELIIFPYCIVHKYEELNHTYGFQSPILDFSLHAFINMMIVIFT